MTATSVRPAQRPIPDDDRNGGGVNSPRREAAADADGASGQPVDDHRPSDDPAADRDKGPHKPGDAPAKDGKAGTGDGGAKAKTSPLKNPLVKAILVLVLLASLAGGGWYGYRYWTTGRFFQSTNDAYVRADQIAMSARISGYIEGVTVSSNQTVTAGQTLVTIEKGQYEARLAQATAQIDAGRADLARAEAELAKQQAQVESARTQLAAAKIKAAFSQSEVDRYVPLAATGAETKEKLAQTRNQRDQDAAQVAMEMASVVSSEKQADSAKAQIQQASAEIEQGEASAKGARIDLASTVIVSPVDGRVGDLSARLGQYTQAGQRLMTVVPVQDLYIEANFKETQIDLMRVGQPVTITVDALSKEKLYGTLASISPGTGSQFSLLPPENATGNFTKVVQRVPVRIAFRAGPQARIVLLPGLSVEVEVDTRDAKGDLDREKQEDERMRRQPS